MFPLLAWNEKDSSSTQSQLLQVRLHDPLTSPRSQYLSILVSSFADVNQLHFVDSPLSRIKVKSDESKHASTNGLPMGFPIVGDICGLGTGGALLKGAPTGVLAIGEGTGFLSTRQKPQESGQKSPIRDADIPSLS